MAQAAGQHHIDEKAQVRARPSLTIKRNLKAPPAKIFAAWTDPAKLALWFKSDADTEILDTDVDARQGGRYTITIRRGDGAHKQVSGVFREVVVNKKLCFTWAGDCDGKRDPESLVTVLIEPDGDGSLLTLIHEQFVDDAARDRHNQGWTGVLNNLEHYLA